MSLGGQFRMSLDNPWQAASRDWPGLRGDSESTSLPFSESARRGIREIGRMRIRQQISECCGFEERLSFTHKDAEAKRLESEVIVATLRA
jgi:hypothetical protein